MTTTIEREIDSALETYYAEKMGKKNYTRLSRLINAANNDLYYGPSLAKNGFVSVCQAISEYFEQFPPPAYYDRQTGEFLDRLPESVEENGEYYTPDYNDIYELNNPVEYITGWELSVYINRF